MIRLNSAVFCWIVLLWTAALTAQESSPAAALRPGRATSTDPYLDALVTEALRRNPEVSAALSAAESARQRIEPAKTLPDPALAMTYQNDGKSLSLGENEMTFLGAMFAQPIPWPGKLRLAGEEARSRAEEIRQGTVGRAELSVEARVRRAYYDYLLAKAQLEQIEHRTQSWRGMLDTVRERYAAGLGVQQDVLRAQIEVIRLDEARAEQEAQVASRKAEVNRALGRAQDTEIDTPARLTLRPQLPELPDLLAAVHDRSPEIAGISRAIEAARSRVELAKKNRLPDFVASGGPMYRGGLDPMWQVGLGITLPVFPGSRQRPLIAAAEADLRAEEARAVAAAQELEFRTRERFAGLTSAMKIARVYTDGVLPVDEISVESAIASYRTGKVPFVTVLEALNTLYFDRSLLLTRLAEMEKWRVSIDEADLQATSGMAAAASGAAGAATVGAGAPAAGMTSSSMR